MIVLSRCSKLIAIKLRAISEMHAKVRRESVAGYATDETLVCGPKEHTRWWQRYRGHLQGLLYRLILNSYLTKAAHHLQAGWGAVLFCMQCALCNSCGLPLPSSFTLLRAVSKSLIGRVARSAPSSGFGSRSGNCALSDGNLIQAATYTLCNASWCWRWQPVGLFLVLVII